MIAPGNGFVHMFAHFHLDFLEMDSWKIRALSLQRSLICVLEDSHTETDNLQT